jgi:fumarate reductase subunit D
MKELSLLLILTLLPLGAVAQSEDMNLDSIYMSYMSDSSKAQIQKVRSEMARIEQQEKEREEQQMLWYLVLAGCAISAILVTGGIFREVFQGQEGAPLINKIRAGAICLCGGIAIFLLDVAWLYMSFEANQKIQKLILFAILLVLGIALWIYTKNLKKDNTDNV